MLHFNCSPTIFYLHQIWHQTCFSSIFNISLLNFLPKHYIIRNIISSESTYSFLQNTNMQKSKYLTSKILLKSSHNQRQLIIITKYNNFEIIVRKGIPSFHPSRIHTKPIKSSGRHFPHWPYFCQRHALSISYQSKGMISSPVRSRSIQVDIYRGGRRKDVAGHTRPWSMALDISGARSP